MLKFFVEEYKGFMMDFFPYNFFLFDSVWIVYFPRVHHWFPLVFKYQTILQTELVINLVIYC